MKKIRNIMYVLLLSISLIACSNMTVGFEEDSVFYTKPGEDSIFHTKKKTSSEPTVKTATENIGTTANAPTIKIEPDKIEKEEATLHRNKERMDEDSENPTTFSYDPYEGE